MKNLMYNHLDATMVALQNDNSIIQYPFEGTPDEKLLLTLVFIYIGSCRDRSIIWRSN